MSKETTLSQSLTADTNEFSCIMRILCSLRTASQKCCMIKYCEAD